MSSAHTTAVDPELLIWDTNSETCNTYYMFVVLFLPNYCVTAMVWLT